VPTRYVTIVCAGIWQVTKLSSKTMPAQNMAVLRSPYLNPDHVYVITCSNDLRERDIPSVSLCDAHDLLDDAEIEG
jgi:hypothetical protein